jgi:hypothetical protein
LNFTIRTNFGLRRKEYKNIMKNASNVRVSNLISVELGQTNPWKKQ